MKELNRFREFLNEEEENQMKTLAKLLRDEADQPDNKVGKSIFLKYAAQAEKTDVKDIKSLLRKLEDELIDKHPDTFSGEDDIVGSFLSTSRQFLNENEDDGYDRASKELFDMTWDEVRRENDPRMRQAVHDEVQKDDDTYIDDVQEAEDGQEAYFEKLLKEFEEVKKALIDVARVQLASAAYGYNFDPSQVGGFAKDERKVRKYLRAGFRDVKSNMRTYIKQNYLKDKYWEDDPNALFGYLRDNIDNIIYNLETKLNSVISSNGERLNDPKYKEKYKFQLLLIETIKKTISILEKFKLTIAKDPRTTGNAVKQRGRRAVNERKDFTPEFYEVTYTALDGNLVERDFKHFTDKGEAIAFHNSLKDNDEIALAIIDKVYYDPKSFLSGRSEQAYYSNPIHQSFLNSRSGDKRFEEPESLMKFLDRKLKGRNEVGTSLALNEFDDKSMEDYGDAMKVALGNKKMGSPEDEAQKRFDRLSKDDQTKLLQIAKMVFKEKANTKDIEEQNLSLEEIYKDIMEVDEEEEKIRKEYDGMKRPSQDEVNDAFEKFEREAHYLNNKPVGEWDAADMSNWKSILRKDGKMMESMNLESIYEDQGFLTDARYKLYYTTKDGKENSIGFISGLTAEDEFYELMDDENIVSAKIDYVYTKSGKPELSMEFTRDESGEANVKFG